MSEMARIEIVGEREAASRVQRFSHYFTISVCIGALLIALNMRTQFTTASTFYTNVQAGISVRYPQGWLLNEDDADYVMRVRDLTRMGYKTTIQVGIEPVGSGASAQNVLALLSIRRSTTLATYRSLSSEAIVLPNELTGLRQRFYFTATETDPFLESIPVVVSGEDIVVIQRGQAVVITFLADSATFDVEYAVFQRFLANLEF
jgi:hypothetical protein